VLPTGRYVVLNDAEPLTRVSMAITVAPLRKVTVPVGVVADEGSVTVTLRITFCP
jgi:hypothetical protein